MSSRSSTRILKEIKLVESNKGIDGIVAWVDQSPHTHPGTKIYARIQGLQGTPYESGVFKVEINLSERYPFEPPHVHMKTPVYHPNIDHDGRICLNILKTPPAGSWSPSLNVISVLQSLRVLLAEPNPDDPLVEDIAAEFRDDRTKFETKAREHTLKYANTSVISGESSSETETKTTQAQDTSCSTSPTSSLKPPVSTDTSSGATKENISPSTSSTLSKSILGKSSPSSSTLSNSASSSKSSSSTTTIPKKRTFASLKSGFQSSNTKNSK